jgi:Predicted RNA-binding protein of the translin family
VKYSLKTCETVLYELSVTGCDVPKASPQVRETKRARIVDDKIPYEELDELRKRMVHRDDMRENVIKICRDAQKAAKQAIYALHRENVSEAEKLIGQCERCILDKLRPMIDKEPPLRYGSFANVLEEYAEAKMFHGWLLGTKDDEAGTGFDLSKPRGKVLMPDDFAKVQLEPEDYIGGLCDLTGEIGRFAVKKGTERNADGVKLCLETNTSILYAIESLSKLPGGGGLGKKIDPLRNSVEKLEKMLYELSLVKATGRNITADIHNSSEMGSMNE